MRWATYNRLMDRLVAADGVADELAARLLGPVLINRPALSLSGKPDIEPTCDRSQLGDSCLCLDNPTPFGKHQSLGKHCESLPAEVRVRPDTGSPVRPKADDLALATSHLAQSSSASRFTARRRRPPRPGDPGKVAIPCST